MFRKKPLVENKLLKQINNNFSNILNNGQHWQHVILKMPFITIEAIAVERPTKPSYVWWRGSHVGGACSPTRGNSGPEVLQ